MIHIDDNGNATIIFGELDEITAKSYGVRIFVKGQMPADMVWFPKSQCTLDKVPYGLRLKVPAWLVQAKRREGQDFVAVRRGLKVRYAKRLADAIASVSRKMAGREARTGAPAGTFPEMYSWMAEMAVTFDEAERAALAHNQEKGGC